MTIYNASSKTSTSIDAREVAASVFPSNMTTDELSASLSIGVPGELKGMQ